MAVDYYYSYNQTEHKVEEEDEDEDEDEEDYIDMEVSSFAHFFSLSKNTPLCSSQHNREFEFQMSSSSMNVLEKQESTTSPADELFYMGKLLPLHLPPRLQMVEKLLQDSTPKMFSHHRANNVDEFYSTPFDTNAGTSPATGHTPFESCDASPVDSCQVSRELNPEEYFRAYASNEGDHQKRFDDSNNNNSNTNNKGNAKKSWTKKLKTKIKSLFGKSSGDHQETAALTLTLTSPSVSSGLPVKTKDEGGDSENENKEMEVVVTRDNKEVKEAKICHRRSFSGALFKRRPSSTANKLSSISSSSSAAGLSTSSSSSSSSSSSTSTSNSNGLKELLKRSSSASSEIETSLIQGAIAHCKRSSQPEAMIQSRKTLSEAGCHSFPSSRFASIDHDHDSSLCRG